MVAVVAGDCGDSVLWGSGIVLMVRCEKASVVTASCEILACGDSRL